MTTDQKGHVYATGPGGVWILTPEGKHLGTIRLPEGGANLAFGDPDGKGLYIATRRSVFRVPDERRGASPADVVCIRRGRLQPARMWYQGVT